MATLTPDDNDSEIKPYFEKALRDNVLMSDALCDYLGIPEENRGPVVSCTCGRTDGKNCSDQCKCGGWYEHSDVHRIIDPDPHGDPPDICCFVYTCTECGDTYKECERVTNYRCL